MSNRNIIIVCKLPNPKQRCILDGQGISRIFYGANTSLHINGINFINASTPSPNAVGSAALSFHSSSNIIIKDSSFLYNTARYGGAIMISNSTLLLNTNNENGNAIIRFKGKC